MIRRLVCMLALAALSLLPRMAGAAGAAEASPFSAAEVRQIMTHGPWPVVTGRDPSNRVSGNRAAIDLGAKTARARARVKTKDRAAERWGNTRARIMNLKIIFHVCCFKYFHYINIEFFTQYG